MRKLIRVSYEDLHRAYPKHNTIQYLNEVIPFKDFEIIDESTLLNHEYDWDITKEEIDKLVLSRKKAFNFILIVNTSEDELIQSKLSFRCNMEII